MVGNKILYNFQYEDVLFLFHFNLLVIYLYCLYFHLVPLSYLYFPLYYYTSHNLKVCVCYFLSIFCFFPSKTIKKCFSFHLKSSFRPQGIKIFVIFLLPFHTFQILKDKWNWIVYDVMNWLAQICSCNYWNNPETALYYTIKLSQIMYN